MRLWKASSSTSPVSDMRPTNMPKPWRMSTMPTACSALSASRTELRLMLSSSISSDSVGSGSPAPSRRERMICLTVSWTSTARLGRADGAVTVVMRVPWVRRLVAVSRSPGIAGRYGRTSRPAGGGTSYDAGRPAGLTPSIAGKCSDEHLRHLQVILDRDWDGP